MTLDTLRPPQASTLRTRLQGALGQGPVTAAALVGVLEPALTAAAGEGGARRVAVLSLVLDAPPLAQAEAPGAAGLACSVEAWVERATRTLVFASAEARTAEGALLAAGSAVFRVDDTAG